MVLIGIRLPIHVDIPLRSTISTRFPNMLFSLAGLAPSGRLGGFLYQVKALKSLNMVDEKKG